jgi:phosphonatase-like hydrolase
MIRMVVFDMAGTTVNEDNVVYKTLHRAINEAGFNFTLDQVLAEGAGKEKLQAIKSILSIYERRHDDKLSADIYGHFINYLGKAYSDLEVLPQQNAKKLFKTLKEKNILVVLNTGYNAETAQSLLKKLGWKKGEDFDDLITATDVKSNRPDPDMILLAMEHFHIKDGGEVVKVGDSTIDIEEGKNAGCALSIGITTGAHTREQLHSAKPDFIIDNLIDLLPLLN